MHVAGSPRMMGECEPARSGHRDTKQKQLQEKAMIRCQKTETGRGTSLLLLCHPNTPVSSSSSLLLSSIGPGSMKVWEVAMTTVSSYPFASLPKWEEEGCDSEGGNEVGY